MKTMFFVLLVIIAGLNTAAPAAAPPPAPEIKPGTVSLNLVEAPPSPPTYAAPEPPANPPPS